MTPSARRHVLLPCVAALLLAVGIPALARPAQQPSAPPVTPIRASALEIRQIHSDDVKLPAEFQMSMYENVVDQVDKTKRFEHVYRDGDRDAAAAPELVTLNCTVTGFKEGSAEARQVTTVAGATSITVHLVFTDKNGKTLFENDVKGQVRLFGENLRATYDFGKKTAAVVRTDFLPATPEHK
jgi:hypothetical protein